MHATRDPHHQLGLRAFSCLAASAAPGRAASKGCGVPNAGPGAAASVAAVVLLLGLFGSGCSIEGQGESGHEHAVFNNLRTDIVKPVERPAPMDPADWEWPARDARRWVLEIAGHGEIEIELYPELAPETVANFEKLASQGFYDQTRFHRVIEDFMIQGGDPNSRDADPRNDGQGGPGYEIADEFSQAPHVRGTVSMANRSAPGTAGSQFFIMQADRQSLDGSYTAFAQVVRGMDVVDRIASLETDLSGRWGPKDRPLQDVVLARVFAAGAEPTQSAALAPTGAVAGAAASGAGAPESGASAGGGHGGRTSSTPTSTEPAPPAAPAR